MLEIAIVGRPKEPEVDKLALCLAQLGNPPLVIDTDAFPQQSHLTFSEGHWLYQENNLNDVKVFFLRSFRCIDPMEKLEPSEDPRTLEMIALREKDSMLGSLLRSMADQGKPTLNPFDTLLCHYYKLYTVERLRQAGVPVPPMMATNDSDAVQAFANTYKQIVCKPLAGGAIAIGLSAAGISEQFYPLLKIAPVMLQARIYGHDVRAYVLQDQVIAAASTITNQIDVRSGNRHFQPTALTHAETAGVIQVVRLLSLSFASIDFKRTSDGRYFIVDINPTPRFVRFERITGLEVTNPIAKHLIALSSGHALS